MKSFEFVQPKTIEDAIEAWSPDAAWLAGGTNLVDLMKTGAVQPGRLIDITRLPGLRGIDVLADGSTRIGALVSNADLASDADFARRYPMVAEALLSGASGQLRNAATVGGNIMQYPRDAFFRDLAWEQHEQSGATLSVLGADGAQIAVNPSDFCVPLVALDAVVEVIGPDGARDIALSDLHVLPGDPAGDLTALEHGELILALRLPAGTEEFAAHSRYLKVRDRTSFAFAQSSAAASLRIEGGRIAEARLALGAVAPKPWRVTEAEALLAGQSPDTGLFERAAQVALAGAMPPDGADWRVELARRTAARALAMAAAGTPARMPALPASPFGTQAGDPAHA